MGELCFYERYLSSIPLTWWPHCEMQPHCPIPILLNQNLVEVLSTAISDIQQNDGIAKRLLNPVDTDIHRTPRQMIRRCRPSHLLIQLRTPIT